MPTTGRAAGTAPSPSDAAAQLVDAPLVQVLVHRSGDAVAAAGVLARALDGLDVPVQVSPTDTRASRERRAAAADPDTVSVATCPGADADVALATADQPASLTAAAIAREAGVAPAPELALAGTIAAGAVPAERAPELLEDARDRGVERRPGVGLAVRDLVDGLAHSTLVHAPFSGDPEAARDALADVGLDPDAAATDGEEKAEAAEEERRTLASLVAIAATDGPAPERAATTVERALRPYAVPDDGATESVPDLPATLAGYADVLDVAAAVAPGATVAYATGHGPLEPVRDAWREGSQRAHAAIDAAEQSRYDGVVAVDATDAPAAVVARIVRDARAPEPTTVALGDDEIGVAVRDGTVGPILAAVADSVGGEVDAGRRRGVVRDPDDVDERAVIDAARAEP